MFRLHPLHFGQLCAEDLFHEAFCAQVRRRAAGAGAQQFHIGHAVFISCQLDLSTVALKDWTDLPVQNSFYTLYDIAMLSFTSYTKIGLRLATFLGFLISLISIAVAFIYFILKVRHWDTFTVGTAPLLIGMFLLGAIQLIFLGLIGEYILSMNARIMDRPLVIEEERINFCEEKEKTGGG